MRFFIIQLFLLCKLLFVLPVSANAQANNQLLDYPATRIEICLNPEINRQTNPNLISDFKFQSLASIKLEKETGYWLKITIDNSTLTEEENYIHFNNIFAETTLWEFDQEKGWVKKSIGGYDIPYSKREKGILYEDKLQFHVSPGTETELLVSVHQPYRDLIFKNQCSVISNSKLEKMNNRTNSIQFWFAGIISVLCIFSLILFLFMRNRAFIIYSLYAIITEIYFLAFDNIIEAGLLFDHPQINRYLYYTLTLSQSLYFLFLNDLLKQVDTIKKQQFVSKYAFASFTAALLIILFSLFNYKIAIDLSDIYTLVNGVVGLYIIAITYKDVPKRIRIVYIGFISLVICGLLALFLTSICPGCEFVYIYQLGFFVELTFFFIAISYTYFIEKNSRVRAMLELSVAETKKLKTEKEALKLKNEVEQKNRKLTIKAIEISENNLVIDKLVESLSVFEKKGTISINDIACLKNSLIGSSKNNYWEEFETYFIEVHPEFYKLLNQKFPDLTKTERRICAFIKLNLSTKEIANITKCNPESIHMTRSRLRKKMGLDKTENLENIIATLK